MEEETRKKLMDKSKEELVNIIELMMGLTGEIMKL